MYISKVLLTLLSLVWAVAATDNGLQTVVTWDEYSLLVNNSRVFILSGEFHYQRLPVPELWLDIFQKYKANGYNTVSIYFFWSYHSASKDSYDFEAGGKDIQKLFDYAKQVGLYIITRAGPYNNAETTAGGFPLWGADGSLGALRSDDEKYHQAWLPWVAAVGKIIERNQITHGGPVILNQHENELTESKHEPNYYLVKYMKQVKAAYIGAGITVPSTHNEKGMRGQSWSTDYQDVGGAVNVYGLDSYAGGLSCTNPDTGFTALRTYYQWFQAYSFTQPSFSPEFRGGWFSPWGDVTNYDDCVTELSPSFPDVFYKNSIGQRMTMKNIYMTYGGTNWGHSAAPVVYTSYDYSAALRETRQIRDKMSQIKLIGLFTRVSKDLLKTRMIGNGTTYATDSANIFTWEIRNPSTNAGFYITQASNTRSRDSFNFSAILNTSIGPVTIPNVNLQSRQSKILVTNYKFGSNELIYSSAEILTYGVFGTKDVIVFYAKEGQVSQFALKGITSRKRINGNSSTSLKVVNGNTVITYTQNPGQTILRTTEGALIYLLEQKTAWRFWAPTKSPNPDVNPSNQIFVFGSYLVRSASIDGKSVKIEGDNDVATTIEVFTGDSKVNSVIWNGASLQTTVTSWGALTARISGAERRQIDFPVLDKWRSKDSLPEINPEYDDSKWRICNKTTTLNPVKPITLPILFADEYGFHAGAKIYRGYFNGNSASAVNLTCSGGNAFGWSAWVNGVYIGGNVGSPANPVTTEILALPASALKSAKNVITVLVDYHGHDQTSQGQGLYNPRGILGASLVSSATNGTQFTVWKVQGNAGGEKNIDPVRGPLNEGGLFGERMGWHLPGFNPDSSFTNSSQLSINKAGVQWFITDFTLKLDDDLDVPLGIEFTAPKTTKARVLLFVNGYQYGKYIPYIGPQTRFVIPPGIVNNKGVNRLAISLWSVDGAGAAIEGVKLFNYGKYQSGFGFGDVSNGLQPQWNKERLDYK